MDITLSRRERAGGVNEFGRKGHREVNGSDACLPHDLTSRLAYFVGVAWRAVHKVAVIESVLEAGHDSGCELNHRAPLSAPVNRGRWIERETQRTNTATPEICVAEEELVRPGARLRRRIVA